MLTLALAAVLALLFAQAKLSLKANLSDKVKKRIEELLLRWSDSFFFFATAASRKIGSADFRGG